MRANDRLLNRIARVRKDESGVVLACAALFFCILCGYYILRPLRESMAIAGGVGNIQWLFSATFIGMLLTVPIFGWVCGHFTRDHLVPGVYLFFITALLIFYWSFGHFSGNQWPARAFYVWISIFNLFIVSVFWSLMADLFDRDQAHRVFGFIAAGGSAGALTGPTLTAMLVEYIGHRQLLLVSLVWFILAVWLVSRILKFPLHRTTSHEISRPLPGNPFSGASSVLGSPYLLGYSTFLLLLSGVSTFLYFQQANLVSEALPTIELRTQLFAKIDITVNLLSIAGQVFLTGRITRRFGVAAILSIIPSILLVGFVALALNPVLTISSRHGSPESWRIRFC